MNYEIKDVLFFDTETTGVPAKELDWDKDCGKFPYIVQLAWMKDNVLKCHVIKPIAPNGKSYEIPQEASEVHGITTERAIAEGVNFEDVIVEFIQDCTTAPLICAHNIYFDTSMLKANIMRYMGREFYESKVETALFKGKRIDTMMKTIKFVGARFADGRPNKFPTLEELHARCFPDKSYPAHDAGEDVKALAACLPMLVELGFVELAQREYDKDGQPIKKTSARRTPTRTIPKTKIHKAVLNFEDDKVELPKSDIPPIQKEGPSKPATDKDSDKRTSVNALLDGGEF